jgi:hypothetical protein
VFCGKKLAQGSDVGGGNNCVCKEDALLVAEGLYLGAENDISI